MNRKVMIVFVVLVSLLVTSCTKSPIMNNDDSLIPIDNSYLLDENELVGELYVSVNAAPEDASGGYFTDFTHHQHIPIIHKIVQFMDMHPHVKVHVQFAKWHQHTPNSVLVPDFSIMPDIIELTPQQVRWSAAGELEDLSFYLENKSSRLQSDREYRTMTNTLNDDGALHLLPFRSDPLIVYYAANILEDLGVEEPEKDWGWDDFFSMMQFVHKEGYVDGSMIRMENIEHIIAMLGGRYMSLDYSGFVGHMDDAQTVTAYQTYISTLGHDVLEMANETDLNVILNRKTPIFGLVRASKWLSTTRELTMIYRHLHGTEANYKMISMPSSDEYERHNTVLATGLAMSKHSKNKDLAWELIRYIMNDEQDSHLPFDFLASNTLAGGSLAWVRDDLDEDQAEHVDELLQLIRDESLHSRPSTLYLFPITMGGKADDVYEVPWLIPVDEFERNTYLNRFAHSLDEMRDTMIESGLEGLR